MELYNEPSIKQDNRLFKIILVSSLAIGILGFVLFFIGNLAPTKKVMALGNTRYAVANGNWNSTSTWSASSGGAAGASVPVAGDIVYIGEGSIDRAITIPASYTANCASLFIGDVTVNAASSLNLATSTSSLNVSGNVELGRPSGNNTNSLNVGAGSTAIGGNLSFVGTATSTNKVIAVSISTGTLTVSGDLLINQGVFGNNLINMGAGAGILQIGGSFDPTLTDFTQGLGTVVYNGNVAQTINLFPADAYYNLKITNTSAAGATLSAAITTTKLTNNLTIGDGTASSIFSTANYAITFNNIKTLKVEENSHLNAGTSIITFGSGCFATINGNFNTTNTTGFSDASTTAIKNSNNPVITFGTNGKVTYSATSAQTVNDRNNYENLELAGGTKTLSSGTFTINKNFTIGSGVTCTGVTNHPNINLKGNFTNNGTFVQGTGEFNLVGTGSQTIGGSTLTTFEKLKVENVYTSAPQITLNNGIKVNNVLELKLGVVSILNNTIEMVAGSELKGGNINSFVLTTGTGVFKWKNCVQKTTRIFPIGHNPSVMGYAPVEIEFKENSVTDDFSIRLDSTITNNGTMGGTPISQQVVNCTWQISEGTSGGSIFKKIVFNWASVRNKKIKTEIPLQLLHFASNAWTKPNKKNRIEYHSNNMCSVKFENYTGTFSPMGVGEGDGSEGIGLSFTGSPSISGTAGAVGAKYTWNNVGTDLNGNVIKAVIEIISNTGGATLDSMDQTAYGSANAWQPIISGSQSSGSCWGIEFRIRFYNAATDARLTLSGFKAQGVDIDGNGTYLREYNRFDKPLSYTIESSSYLTLTQSSGNLTFKGPTTDVSGIDLTQTNYNVTNSYQNTDSINLVLGSCCDGASCATSAGNRLHSINFFDVLVYTSPLPVKMAYFNARSVENTALLEWATASEINNSHFEVQRSNDTKDWISIGKVEGHGNSNQLVKYEFVDDQPLPENYYRLKQVDYDGKFDFSTIKFVNMKATQPSVLNCKVYPNPTNGIFTLEVKSKSKSEIVLVEVSNLQGQIVKEMSFEPDGSNYLSSLIDISSLDNGIYMVKVLSGASSQTIKIRKN
jgi:hypothetical protein